MLPSIILYVLGMVLLTALTLGDDSFDTRPIVTIAAVLLWPITAVIALVGLVFQAVVRLFDA